MNKKALPLLIILILSLCCISFVFADNNTTDNATVDEIEDLMDYIIPISITDNGIEFSDGFTGFCLDLSKDAINVDDKFTSDNTSNDEIENNVKMAIIDCYESGNEANIGDVISQVLNGNKKYDVLNATFNSGEIDDDTITVNLDNSTEATFEFEILKAAHAGKSDCLAYKVTTNKITNNDDVLGASDDESDDTIETESENNTEENDTLAVSEDNATPIEQDANDGENNTSETENQDADDGQTTVNETNKTIINKTNTVIVNENNTTVINQKNVKVINKTNETPKNATVQDQIMRTVGNPIFLLVIVIVIIAVVAVVMRRKN